MAAHPGLPIPANARLHQRLSSDFPVASLSSAARKHRRIDPRAGRAIEALGHAIEYLTDDSIHRSGDLAPKNESLRAIQLLMALNRQIYAECPVVPTLAERCQRLLHLL